MIILQMKILQGVKNRKCKSNLKNIVLIDRLKKNALKIIY